MKFHAFRPSILLAMLVTLLTASGAFALEPGKDGYYHTGDGVRTKTIAIITAKVYAIRHDMKELPAQKSKQAVINIDTDKKFTWMMLRDVDNEKIQKALREAFAMNGYGDQVKIGQFVSAFSKELKEKAAVSIAYTAASKTTTI